MIPALTASSAFLAGSGAKSGSLPKPKVKAGKAISLASAKNLFQEL
jgi:hypothetical protein